MDTSEESNAQIVERVDAQTQTECTAEDLTLSQKLTAIAQYHLESAAPPSRTTSLDKFDKDILRWKDVHFLRDFGDWFNPEKAIQPTYTRLLSSCGYLPPLDPVEISDTSIPNQGERALVSPDVMITGSVTDVERGFGQCFTPKAEDTTAVEHTPTDTTIIDTDIDTISTGDTQTTRSLTVTVGPSLDDASAGDNPDSDSDPTVSSQTDSLGTKV